MKYKCPSINLFLPNLAKWILLFASKNHSNLNVKTLISKIMNTPKCSINGNSLAS